MRLPTLYRGILPGQRRQRPELLPELPQALSVRQASATLDSRRADGSDGDPGREWADVVPLIAPKIPSHLGTIRRLPAILPLDRQDHDARITVHEAHPKSVGLRTD
jgi:hypothetical protein